MHIPSKIRGMQGDLAFETIKEKHFVRYVVEADSRTIVEDGLNRLDGASTRAAPLEC